MKKLKKYSFILVIFCTLILFFNNWVLLKPPKNFTESKQYARELFDKHRVTFYCGCQYDARGVVDWSSCEYKPKKVTARSRRIEWEHIMPAHYFGKNLSCWNERICRRKSGAFFKGRKCCSQISPEFIQMEADLHNLVPELGDLNIARSNFSFGILPQINANAFGSCQIKIDKKRKMVEPRPGIRGVIARAYLYMSSTYNIPLSDAELKLFKNWSAQYPPESWEIIWDQKVAKIQGNHNRFIQSDR